jgi:hypothetical protein
MAEPIRKYNSEGKLIYEKDLFGYEYWYDQNENMIYYKSPYGYKSWCGYDEHHYNIFHLNTKDLIILEKISFLCGRSK